MTADAVTLDGSRSPFLRHGAMQPVRWMPWGDRAFERARREGLPILLDIGAVWCHWCHVMDRESYEDPETAALINELFVPVKVDRDERPDVDARYQRAVQVLTGQGGWPLTAFLTPDGEVYYGGTYFPPDDRHGRPSFRRVLMEVSRVWLQERERALEAARGITERLDQHGRAEAQSGDLSPGLISETLEELANSFDFRYGGFGRAPKFPNAGGIDLLLDDAIENGTEWARRIVVETLEAMGRGGIYDQLGGGFHRYSTDARWIIPHFEKMAYDNGVLLQTYARAARALDAPSFAGVARGIARYYRAVAPVLVDEGGFPASQDADHSPDDDGDYWTWTLHEIEAALGDAGDVEAARLFFGLDDPAGAMHIDPARHVLFRALDEATLARRLGADAPATASRIERIRTALLAARERRPRPFVDETLYTGWVALVASGHIAAARHLADAPAGAAALAALDRIMRDAFRPDRGLLHRVGDPDSGELLEDHAHVAAALVDAFELTQQPERLTQAGEVMALLLGRFRDPSSGAFLDRPRDADAAVPALAQRHLPIADAPAPAGNAVAALTLLRLGALTHEERYHTIGEQVLRAFAGSAPRLVSAAATWVKALAWATRPVTTVVVVDAGPARDSALFRAAIEEYRPRTVVRYFSPGAVEPATLPRELRAMIGADAPHAYLCAGTVCAAPVADADALRRLVRGPRG